MLRNLEIACSILRLERNLGILRMRKFSDCAEHIHAYRWQQQGREGREDRREGEGEDRREGEGEDRREEAPHQLELQQIEKI